MDKNPLDLGGACCFKSFSILRFRGVSALCFSSLRSLAGDSSRMLADLESGSDLSWLLLAGLSVFVFISLTFY